MYNDLFSVGPLTVHTYGLCIGIGIAAALLLIWCRAERRGMDTQDVNRLVLLVLVTGFAGAKLFYLFAHMDEFLSDPLGTLGAEGFVVYGGIVCGLLAAYLFCRKRSLPFSAWADGFIPGVAVAQGFGRIGCFFAGCCFGVPAQGALGVVFPAGSLAPAGVSLVPVQLFPRRGIFCSPRSCCCSTGKSPAPGFSRGCICCSTASVGFSSNFCAPTPAARSVRSPHRSSSRFSPPPLPSSF